MTMTRTVKDFAGEASDLAARVLELLRYSAISDLDDLSPGETACLEIVCAAVYTGKVVGEPKMSGRLWLVDQLMVSDAGICCSGVRFADRAFL